MSVSTLSQNMKYFWIYKSSEIKNYVCKYLEMTAEDEDTAADPSDLPSPPRLVVGRLFNIEMLLDQVVK